MGNAGTTDFEVVLSAAAGAPGLARGFVGKHAASLPQDLIDDVKVLVSELVTNAVRHGCPTITLRLSLDPPLIGASVQDEGAEIPSTDIRALDLDSPGGLGLMIVDRMSSSWGVDACDPPPGKIVWFQIDEPAA